METLFFCEILLLLSIKALALPLDDQFAQDPSLSATDSDGYHSLPTQTRTSRKKSVDWQELGKESIRRSLDITQNLKVKRAKNVILFLGDGMGFTSSTAGRWYRSQYHTEEFADDFYLPWDHFSHAGMALTYNTDQIVADSAGTATAFMCGEKAAAGVIGANQNTVYDNCSSQKGNEIQSVLHTAIQKDKWTGLVTTARVTHATPAAAFAHSASRNWESSAPEGCDDIAAQLISNPLNHEIRVIMGGGRRIFLSNDTFDPEYPTYRMHRVDGRNIIQEWKEKMIENGIDRDNIAVVYNQSDFDNIDVNSVERVLGLFEHTHMQFELDRNDDTWGEPSLTEMVDKTIDILKRSEDGYFLLVEGGRIDHANHDTNAKRMLEDLVEFGRSVSKAVEKTDDDETLIIVTADHSHVLGIGGYVTMDTDILGYDPVNSIGADNKPFTVLSYANGPGYYDHRTYNGSLENEIPRKNITGIDTAADDFLQDAGVAMSSETHGGDDVGIYAQGPMAHLIHSSHEQSYIAHVMAFAACFSDPDADHCVEKSDGPTDTSSALHHSVINMCILLIAWHAARSF